MKDISEMEPSRKKNRKRPRQCKDEEQDAYLAKKVKVVGPCRETNPIHALRDLPVAIERSKDPKIPPYHRRNLHLFYQSLVEHKMKPVVVRELDDDWSFDENMDPDLVEAWRPIMNEPLLPYVIGLKDYLKL